MKFIPTEKDKWVEQSDLPYGNEKLELIYDCLMEEMPQALIVLEAIGGHLKDVTPEPLPVLELNNRKYSTLQEVPDYLAGRVFKDLVKRYEDRLYDFERVDKMPQITVDELIIKLQVHGMVDCIWQLYAFSSALENGRGIHVDFIEQGLAAFELAHELGVHPREITPEKAFEYLNKKK